MKAVLRYIAHLSIAMISLFVVFGIAHYIHSGVNLFAEEYYTTVQIDEVDIILAADGEHIMLRTTAEVFPIMSCGFLGLRACRIGDVTKAQDAMKYVTIDPEHECFAITRGHSPSAVPIGGCAFLESAPDLVVR